MNKLTYLSFMEWWRPGIAKCTQIRSVNPNISGEYLAPCIWHAVFLCSCSVMNCADSDHFCRWFSGLHFVYQIMSQWFIIIFSCCYEVMFSCYEVKSCRGMKVKSSQVSSLWISSPSQVESFSLFSQASHKSLNLRLESDSSQVMWSYIDQARQPY